MRASLRVVLAGFLFTSLLLPGCGDATFTAPSGDCAAGFCGSVTGAVTRSVRAERVSIGTGLGIGFQDGSRCQPGGAICNTDLIAFYGDAPLAPGTYTIAPADYSASGYFVAAYGYSEGVGGGTFDVGPHGTYVVTANSGSVVRGYADFTVSNERGTSVRVKGSFTIDLSKAGRGF